LVHWYAVICLTSEIDLFQLASVLIACYCCFITLSFCFSHRLSWLLTRKHCTPGSTIHLTEVSCLFNHRWTHLYWNHCISLPVSFRSEWWQNVSFILPVLEWITSYMTSFVLLVIISLTYSRTCQQIKNIMVTRYSQSVLENYGISYIYHYRTPVLSIDFKEIWGHFYSEKFMITVQRTSSTLKHCAGLQTYSHVVLNVTFFNHNWLTFFRMIVNTKLTIFDVALLKWALWNEFILGLFHFKCTYFFLVVI